MLDDQPLLRRYAAEGSEAAFGELVGRYVNLVYSAALRRVGGDAQRAQDVAQLVFTDLARKAGSLPSGVVLAGWLHRATRYAAAELLRTERRRQAREREAAAMHALSSEPTPDWNQIRPLLDAALDRLSRTHRDALVLRYFEERSLAEVGQVLGLDEDAARKRVSRALDKLRADLVRRGVRTTAGALSTAISVNAVQAAPAGLTAALTSASLAAAAGGTGTTLTLLKIMAMTKIKAGIIGAIVIAGVATPLVILHQAQAELRERDATLQQQVNQLALLTAENERLSNSVAQADTMESPSTELLRLRAKVGALQRQNAELAKAVATAQNLPASSGQEAGTNTADASPPAAEPFRSRVQVVVNFGQTLITGGWAIAPGRRMLIFVRPELDHTSSGASTITLHSTGIEMTDSLLGAYGLGALASDSSQTVQHGQLAATADADALLNKLAAEPNTQRTGLGIITTLPGHSAELQSGDSTGGWVKVTVTPSLAPDGQATDLQLEINQQMPTQ